MKICLISREYPWRKPYGGVGVSTAVLARALSRQGHSVSVLTQSPSGTRMEVEEDGLRVIGLPLPPMRALPRRLARFSAIEAAAWSCRVADAFRRGDLRPDVVEAPAMNGEALQLLKLRNRPPVVVRIRGGASLGLKTRGLFRWYHVPIYRRERRSVVLADRVAALSEQALRENAVHFRLALDSAIVLPNPVDTTVFTPSANRPKTPVSFLFVAALTP